MVNNNTFLATSKLTIQLSNLRLLIKRIISKFNGIGSARQSPVYACAINRVKLSILCF